MLIVFLNCSERWSDIYLPWRHVPIRTHTYLGRYPYVPTCTGTSMINHANKPWSRESLQLPIFRMRLWTTTATATLCSQLTIQVLYPVPRDVRMLSAPSPVFHTTRTKQRKAVLRRKPSHCYLGSGTKAGAQSVKSQY